MAKREILSLYEDTPSTGLGRAKAAQSGDTYLLPRLTYSTTGEFTSEVTATATANAFTFNSGSAYGAAGGGKLFTVQDNGAEKFSLRYNLAGGGGYPETIVQGSETQGTNTILFQPGSNAVYGTVRIADALGFNVATIMSSEAPVYFQFNAKTADTANTSSIKFLGFNTTTGTSATAQYSCDFSNNNTHTMKLRSLGGLEIQEGLGLHGNNTYCTAQYNTAGGFAGFVQNTDVVANRVQKNSTFTGGTGTKAYTIDNVVRVLKDMGLMAS